MNRNLVLMVLISFFSSSVSWADCNSKCENLKGTSVTLDSECAAMKNTKEALIADSVLLALDGVIITVCTAACAAIEIPIVGQVTGAACDVASMADSVGDMIGSSVLAAKQNQLMNQIPSIVGGGVQLAMSGGQAYRDFKNLRKSALAGKNAAEVKAAKRGGACMMLAMTLPTVITRGVAVANDDKGIKSSCYGIDALTGGGSGSAMSVAGGTAFGGDVSTSSIAAAASQCGTSCNISGVSSDSILEKGNGIEKFAAATAGGIGSLVSALPNSEDFIEKMAAGNVVGGLKDILPPEQSELAQQLADAAQAVMNDNSVPLGPSTYDSYAELNSGNNSTFNKVGGTDLKSASGSNDILTGLLSFINGGDKGAASKKDPGQGIEKSVLTLGQRALASAGLHSKVESIFDIVSRRVQVVMPRVADVALHSDAPVSGGAGSTQSPLDGAKSK